jgi:hypothetical protein
VKQRLTAPFINALNLSGSFLSYDAPYERTLSYSSPGNPDRV